MSTAALSTLFTRTRTLLLSVPAVTEAGIGKGDLIRESTPKRKEKVPAITFLWVPQGTHRSFGARTGRLVLTVVTNEATLSEQICEAVISYLQDNGRCGNESLTIWQFDHDGGLPTPIHNAEINAWESEAQFKVRYG